MPTNPTRSILGCSCARTAGGHAAAAPTSSVMKSRRRIWIAMCPSRGRSCPCNGGTISRFERAVCDYFTLGSAPGADCKGGYQGHTLAQRPSHPSQPHATAALVSISPNGTLWNIRRRPSLVVNFREVVHSVRTGNADVAKPHRFAEDRMDTHKNARLTPKGREEMVRAVVDRGMSNAAAARQFNTTPKTVGKWVGRFCAEGVDGLRDRSSRPLSSPRQIPLATADAVENLRRERRTQEHIAAEIGISKASISRILKRRGLSRLSSLELQEPRPRYEREKPGEIIHLDIKKLGRFSTVGHRVTGRRTGYCSSQGAGWEFVHVAIDDHSRIARAEIFPDQKNESAVAFLVATVAYFRSLGITVERVMTDNGSCYLSKAFARACKQFAVKHIRIKPYTPQTNGKAERFIQTALREWAYATAFEHSEQRYAALPAWLHRYNWHRPHVSLARKPPISRLGVTGDNLLRLHS